jgi:hypothetical protein
MKKMIFLFCLIILSCGCGDEKAAKSLDAMQICDLFPKEQFILNSNSRVIVKGNTPPDSEIVLVSAEGAGYAFEYVIAIEGIGSPLTLSGNGTMLTAPIQKLEVVDGKIKIKPREFISLIWCKGAEHIYMGKTKIRNYTFESDIKYPLTFKMDDTTNCYIYLCGRGTVTKEGNPPKRIGYDQDAGYWLSLLKQGTELQKQGASQALGWLGDANAVGALISALKNGSAAVRRNAAESLAKIPDGNKAVVALAAACKDSDRTVASVSAESLGKLGKDGIVQLSNMLQDNQLRLLAINGLGWSKSEEAVALLKNILEDPSQDQKAISAAIEAIGRIAPSSAVDILAKLLNHPQKEARIKTIQALAKIGTPGAITAIERVSAVEKDEKVLKAAQEALDTVKKKEKKN